MGFELTDQDADKIETAINDHLSGFWGNSALAHELRKIGVDVPPLRRGRRATREFTVQEDDFIHRFYTVKTVQEIADELSRSRDSVIGRANRLGLSTPKKPKKEKPIRRPPMTCEAEIDAFWQRSGV